MKILKYLGSCLARKKCISILLTIALLERIIFAIIREGYNHPHEIYRVLEPIRQLLFGNSVVIYEFDLHLLSWIPILFHTALIKLCLIIGLENPLHQITFLRIFYAFLSMLSVYGVYYILKNLLNRQYGAFGIIFMILWTPLVYWQIHFFESILVGNLLFIPLMLYIKTGVIKDDGNYKIFLYSFFSGLIFGLMFFIRFHSGIFAILFFAFAIYEKRYNTLIPAILAFTAVLLLGAYIDTLFGIPFLKAPFNNLTFSALQDGAVKNFGAQSFYYYLMLLFKFYSPLLFLALIYLVYKGFWQVKLLSFISFAYLLVYSIISHKEFRFIFPILPLLPVIGFVGYRRIHDSFKVNWSKLYVKVLIIMGLIFTVLYSSYRGLVRYSYNSYSENCILIYELGLWYENSSFKDVGHLLIDADHTFMCGSFPLGSKIGTKGQLELTYSSLTQGIDRQKTYLLLSRSPNSNIRTKLVGAFNSWNLYLVSNP